MPWLGIRPWGSREPFDRNCIENLPSSYATDLKTKDICGSCEGKCLGAIDSKWSNSI